MIYVICWDVELFLDAYSLKCLGGITWRLNSSRLSAHHNENRRYTNAIWKTIILFYSAGFNQCYVLKNGINKYVYIFKNL